MTSWRSPAVVSALLLGVVVGAVLGVTVLSPTGLSPPPDPESPPWSYSVGTGCVPAERVDAGWLVAMTSGNVRAVTFNLTVAHDADETVEASLRRGAPGSYVIEVDAVSTVEEKPGVPDDCISGSTIQGGVSLPADYEELEIVYGGDVVRTVRNDGTTTARHWTLDLDATDAT